VSQFGFSLVFHCISHGISGNFECSRTYIHSLTLLFLGGKVISIIAKPQIYYNSKRLWSQGPQTRWTWLVSNGPARKYKNPFYPARTIVVNLRAMERGGGVASRSVHARVKIKISEMFLICMCLLG